MNIYRITHKYEKNYNIFVESDLNVMEMMKALIRTQFSYEDLCDASSNISSEDLLKVLIKYYGVLDVTLEVSRLLKDNGVYDLDIDDSYVVKPVVVKDFNQEELINYIVIELSEAREHLNYQELIELIGYVDIDLSEASEHLSYQELMESNLIKNEEYKNIIKSSKAAFV